VKGEPFPLSKRRASTEERSVVWESISPGGYFLFDEIEKVKKTRSTISPPKEDKSSVKGQRNDRRQQNR